MKILFVVFNYYPSIGGTQILFQKVAEKLANDYDDDVSVFTTNSFYGPDKPIFKKIIPSFEVINKVKVYRFSFTRIHKKIFRFINKVLMRCFKKRNLFITEKLVGPWSSSLKRAIYKSDAEVIIASSASFLYMLYPLTRLKQKNPKPFIFQGAIHFNYDSKHSSVSQKVLNAIKRSDVYWANTKYEKQRLIALGVNPEKIKTVGISIDVEKFSRGDSGYCRKFLNVKDDELLIAYLGRIEIFKSIDLLLQAARLVYDKFKKIKIVIAGTASAYSNELKQIIANFPADLKNKIHFLENICEDEKINFCNAMDMLILPSVNESFGMVFLEAWACKKPVIGAKIGAVASVITEDTDGLLFMPGDSADLAKQILKLAQNNYMRTAMGENGFNKVMNNYTVKIVAEKCRQTCFEAIEIFENKFPDKIALKIRC
ncbi:MAG: glycosyltransferase family 4 protein [Chitinophagaceae bacterium]